MPRSLISPLQPAIQFNEKDPVYWQLHRFLHWEDYRQSLPRRSSNRDDNGSTSYVPRSQYVTPAVAQRMPLDSRVTDPLPRQRSKRVRGYYATVFNLPQWTDDELDRRPSPVKGAVHPWDVASNSERSIASKAGSDSATPLPSTPVTVIRDGGKTNNGGKTVVVGESSSIVTGLPDVKLSPPKSDDGDDNDDLQPMRRQRAYTDDKKPTNKQVKLKQPLDRRPSSALRSSDPQTAEFLARLKLRSRQRSRSSLRLAIKKETDESSVKKLSNEPKAGSHSTSKSIVLSKLNANVSQSSNKTRKGGEADLDDKPKKKLTLRERVLAEFRDQRKPKAKQKYVPMSRRKLRAPDKKETWDHVQSSVGQQFRENADWTSRRRSSLVSSEIDEALTRRSTRVSFKDEDRKTPLTSKSNVLEPIIIRPLERGPSLNTFRVLPSIATMTTGYDAPGFQMMTSSSVGSQAGINDIAINTDVEQRAIGTSTRDDVVYIYETVEVEKKHHRRNNHHHHHHRHSRHHSKSTQSGETTEDSKRSYQRRHHRRRRHKRLKQKKRRVKRRPRSSSSRSSSSSSNSASSDSSNSSTSTRSDSDSDSTSDSSSFIDSETSLQASPPSSAEKSRRRKSSQKPSDLGGDSGGGGGESKPERIVEFTVRSWSGRTRRMSFAGEELEKNSIESLRNRILNEVGIPKETVQITVGAKGSTPSLSRRGSRRASLLPRIDSASSSSSKKTPLGRSMSLGNFNLKSSFNKPDTLKLPPVVIKQSPQSRRRPSLLQNGAIARRQALNRTKSQPVPQKPPPMIAEVAETEEQGEESGEMSLPPSSRQQRASTTPEKLVEQVVQQVLETCRHCKRKFLPDRLTIHEVACLKTKTSTRKVFDSRKARLTAITTNASDRLILEADDSDKKSEAKKPSLWRERHKAFLEQIRYAKRVVEVEKAGGDVRSLGPAPSTFTADLEMCPKCGRKFNSDTLKRHVPNCKTVPTKNNNKKLK